MNKIISNNILEDQTFRQNVQKENLKRKVLILLMLFFTLLMLYIIISHNYFDVFMNQSNIHIDKEIVTEHNSYGEANIEKQTQESIKRILSDTQISTWTANDQLYPKVSNLSDGNFLVVWQSYLQDSSSIGFNIYGQIFYSNGAKRGNEFHIINSTALSQTSPNVAASSNGKFFVV